MGDVIPFPDQTPTFRSAVTVTNAWLWIVVVVAVYKVFGKGAAGNVAMGAIL